MKTKKMKWRVLQSAMLMVMVLAASCQKATEPVAAGSEMHVALTVPVREEATEYPANGLPYSEGVQTWLKELMLEIRENYVRNGYSFAGLHRRMMEREQAVLSASGYSQQDKRILLRAASIAWYSAHYWQENLSDEDTYSIKDLITCIAGVTADIAGFVTQGAVKTRGLQ